MCDNLLYDLWFREFQFVKLRRLRAMTTQPKKNRHKVLGADTRRVFKIGGSHAITLPDDYLKAHDIKAGDPIQIYFNEIVKLVPVKEEKILEELGHKDDEETG
jgi:antitoxin component of MazEF toxin-antitoxin module